MQTIQEIIRNAVEKDPYRIKISKKEGLTQHTLVARVDKDGNKQWFAVVSPPEKLYGCFAVVKYLYEICSENQEFDSKRTIKPEECDYILKRGRRFYELYKKEDLDKYKKFYLSVWKHEYKQTIAASTDESVFFHFRSKNYICGEDVDTIGKLAFENVRPEIIMKRIHGMDFSQICRKNLTLTEAINLSIKVVDEIMRLHNLPHPMIHGDINRCNLMLGHKKGSEEGEKVYAVDFATSSTENENTPYHSKTFGSYYTLEDFCFRRKKTISSDMYAVGIVLLWLFGVNVRNDGEDNNHSFLSNDFYLTKRKFLEAYEKFNSEFIPSARKHFSLCDTHEINDFLAELRNNILSLLTLYDNNRATLKDVLSCLKTLQQKLQDIQFSPNVRAAPQ